MSRHLMSTANSNSALTSAFAGHTSLTHQGGMAETSVRESREDRMIRQKYELMIKKEEKEKRQKDRERTRQLDEITQEPSM